MAEDSAELKMVKSMLRSVLISCKEGVQASRVQSLYLLYDLILLVCM